MKFPLTIVSNGCRFEIFGVDDYESHSQKEEVVNVVVGDYRGRYIDLKLPASFLLQVADTIYRVTGHEPREQPLRVQIVMMPPAAAEAPAPVLQLVPAADDEVAVIKRRMLEGK